MAENQLGVKLYNNGNKATGDVSRSIPKASTEKGTTSLKVGKKETTKLTFGPNFGSGNGSKATDFKPYPVKLEDTSTLLPKIYPEGKDKPLAYPMAKLNASGQFAYNIDTNGDKTPDIQVELPKKGPTSKLEDRISGSPGQFDPENKLPLMPIKDYYAKAKASPEKMAHLEAMGPASETPLRNGFRTYVFSGEAPKDGSGEKPYRVVQVSKDENKLSLASGKEDKTKPHLEHDVLVDGNLLEPIKTPSGKMLSVQEQLTDMLGNEPLPEQLVEKCQKDIAKQKSNPNYSGKSEPKTIGDALYYFSHLYP